MSRDMIDNLVPPMAERIVAQRLRESVKEQGGLIHKDMLSFRADLAQLRQGATADCLQLYEVTVSTCILLFHVSAVSSWALLFSSKTVQIRQQQQQRQQRTFDWKYPIACCKQVLWALCHGGIQDDSDRTVQVTS